MLKRSTSSASLWLHSKHEVLFADQVMREEDWQKHRSVLFRHGVQPGKLVRVVFGYFWVLIVIALLSVCVGVYSTVLVERYGWPMISLPAVQTVFGAITFALTLLLVFKTNNSYSRWWEARRDVGQLVSLAHNITRQAVAYFPHDQAELTLALGRWAGASMWVAKALVRQSADLRLELRDVLLPHELDWLMDQQHKQLALGQALSTIVAAARIDEIVKSRFDSMITLWTFEFGACGRIYNTAIPLCFTRHTSRFLTCYLALLPVLLWPMSGWGTPALAVIISFLLLGVENIGVMIEEPFHVIAFDAFCPAIHRDIQNILKMHHTYRGGTNMPVIGGLNSPSTAENQYQPPLKFTSPHYSQEPAGAAHTATLGVAGHSSESELVLLAGQHQQHQQHKSSTSSTASLAAPAAPAAQEQHKSSTSSTGSTSSKRAAPAAQEQHQQHQQHKSSTRRVTVEARLISQHPPPADSALPLSQG